MIPLHHHVYHHVRKHHKKYLFLGTAMAAFFAITKIMVFFATSFALFATSHDTSFADQLPLDVITQDTGIVLSGDVTPTTSGDIDVSLLDGIGSGTTVTGDTTIDTGAFLYLLSVRAAAEFGTGTDGTGAVDTGAVARGSILSGTTNSGSMNSGTIVNSGVSTTGYYENLLANQITYCHTGDLLMSTLLSGQVFAKIASFQWTLSGQCILDNLSFQLYDHNNQWIEIAQLSGSNRGFSFDSHFLSTGWYATTGLNASGQVYTINPGLYSGVASSFWTGYKVRILNSNGNVLYHSSGFTLDNIAPTIIGASLVYSGNTSGGAVHLLFSGSELLSGVSVSLSAGTLLSASNSGSVYDYVIGGFGTGFSGSVLYNLSFSDIGGNTGIFSGNTSLSFSGADVVPTALTGTFSALLAMKQEISKFNSCKDDLTYKPITLNISKKTFNLNMPNFQKDDIKKLVSAFSYFVVKKLDSVHTLTQPELDELTKTYNNFLVVLKLMKDDDNECKQNLGNYYMGLFATTMQNYGITELY